MDTLFTLLGTVGVVATFILCLDPAGVVAVFLLAWKAVFLFLLVSGSGSLGGGGGGGAPGFVYVCTFFLFLRPVIPASYCFFLYLRQVQVLVFSFLQDPF